MTQKRILTPEAAITTSPVTTKKPRAPRSRRKPKLAAQVILELIQTSLDDGKAEDVVTVDLLGQSSIADYIVIASGRADRHVIALADQIASKLKEAGMGRVSIEGKNNGDWVLIDAGDVTVHIFRPAVRTYYNLEKMLGVQVPNRDPDSDDADESGIDDAGGYGADIADPV